MPKYLVILTILLCPAWPCRAYEFLVNQPAPGIRRNPALASDGSDLFVVTWDSYRQHSQSGDIYARLFDSRAIAITDEFRVNQAATGNQKLPDVAMDADGYFIIVWQSLDPNSNPHEIVFARRFDPNGTPLGNQFRLSDDDQARQTRPAIASNTRGTCLAIWQHHNMDCEQNRTQLAGRRLYTHNENDHEQLLINADIVDLRNPAALVFENDFAAAAWLRQSSTISVHMRYLDQQGRLFLEPFPISQGQFTSLSRLSMAADESGACIVAWDGHSHSYLMDDIYLARFHHSQAPLEPLAINIDRNGRHIQPAALMWPDGRFAVFWQGRNDDESSMIHGRRFPAQPDNLYAPDATGDEFTLNIYRAFDQKRPAAATLGSGRFVVAWQNTPSSWNSNILATVGPEAKWADFNNDGFVNFSDYSQLANDWLAQGTHIKADLFNRHKVDILDLSALAKQWLSWKYPRRQVDLNADGVVDFLDYALLADQWQQKTSFGNDITGTGCFTAADLQALLRHWPSPGSQH